ncbi:TetR/AcrR family transcriptional regulator [Stutzerimonas stutzeri]|uniref:TetR/AcrR family transcriptional regulator n=1 Tax=Stutzerimonas stutzeri TaxID=316 RepID=UPI001C2E920C|nr:TetR/AcrR family transcriptional regulator [Stutzerimonas stutzeri]
MPKDTKPRTAGRPAASKQVQRDQLLDVATRTFADSGIQAASLRRIAATAGVTPALLNYYFGNKQQLVEAMVEERFLPLVAHIAEQLRPMDDPHQLVRTFVCSVSEMVRRNPWLPPLWVREILCEGGLLRAQLTTRIAPMVPLLLAQRFAAAQARGTLNPALDPRLLVVSLIGVTLLPYAAEPIWRGIFANPDIGHEALVSHTLALLERGMEV